MNKLIDTICKVHKRKHKYLKCSNMQAFKNLTFSKQDNISDLFEKANRGKNVPKIWPRVSSSSSRGLNHISRRCDNNLADTTRPERINLDRPSAATHRNSETWTKLVDKHEGRFSCKQACKTYMAQLDIC